MFAAILYTRVPTVHGSKMSLILDCRDFPHPLFFLLATETRKKQISWQIRHVFLGQFQQKKNRQSVESALASGPAPLKFIDAGTCTFATSVA